MKAAFFLMVLKLASVAVYANDFSWRMYNDTNSTAIRKSVERTSGDHFQVRDIFSDSHGRIWMYNKQIPGVVLRYDGDSIEVLSDLREKKWSDGFYSNLYGWCEMDSAVWKSERYGLYRITDTITYIPDTIYDSGNPDRIRWYSNASRLRTVGNEIWGYTDFGKEVITYDGEKYAAREYVSEFGDSVAIVDINDAEDLVWVATTNGLWREDDSTWTKSNTDNSGIPSNIFTCLAKDKENKLWASVMEPAAIIQWINDSTLRVFDSTSTNGLLRKGTIPLHMMFDHSNGLWVSTMSSGLYHYDGSEWSRYTTENSELASNHIIKAAEDMHGNIWIDVDMFGIFCCGIQVLERNPLDGRMAFRTMPDIKTSEVKTFLQRSLRLKGNEIAGKILHNSAALVRAELIDVRGRVLGTEYVTTRALTPTAFSIRLPSRPAKGWYTLSLHDGERRIAIHSFTVN